MAKIEAIAQFNKINKNFITVLGKVEDPSLLNQEFYLYQDIEIDIETETIIGTYDSFQIVSIIDQPLEITEDTLNSMAREKILELYPMEKQLTILGETLERIADSLSIPCDELKEMNDYIQEVKRANQIRKDFYAANPDYKYLSTEEYQQIMDEKYEGGIQEFDPIVVRI